MKLRSNLGFLGDSIDKIISVQLAGVDGKVLNIKPTDYREFISFLHYLNNSNKCKMNTFDNKQVYLNFLKHYDLVYNNFDEKHENNPRLLNFVNNFMDTTE